MKRAIAVLIALLLVFSLSAAACAEGYGYTVRIFAGAKGTINGGDVLVLNNVPYGTVPGFDLGTVKVTDEKYYVRGIRESGRDNDTVSAMLPVTRDTDYVVAYGIKGDEVAYTVRYLRASDKAELAPAATYYGNVGDKPVVAYKFIDGYTPKYYNLTKTLDANAAGNVFTFEYEKSAETVAQEQANRPVIPAGNARIVYGAPGANANPAAPAGGSQTPGAGSAPDAAQQEQQPSAPENILDLDVPLAEGSQSNSGSGSAAGMSTPAKVALTGLGIGGAAGLAWFLLLLRRKKKEQEENS